MKTKISGKSIGIFCIGLLWGAAFMFFGCVLFLRCSLLDERVTELDFEKVEKNLSGGNFPGWTIQNAGCVLPVSRDGSRMRAFRLCNGEYAAEMIDSESDRKISAILPCVFSIYEKKDGKTYVSRMNMRLVGYILGGSPGQVLPRDVTQDQERILRSLEFRKP